MVVIVWVVRARSVSHGLGDDKGTDHPERWNQYQNTT